MHCQYIGSTDSQFLSNKDMFLWLSRGDLKQKLKVKRYSTRSGITNKLRYYKEKQIAKCRLSQQFDKTIDIISGCPYFTKEQYVKKHERVCTKLHFNICKEMGVKLDSEHWYEHVPKSIETSHGSKVTTLWNQTGANRQNHP